jgi:hypothetical protein
MERGFGIYNFLYCSMFNFEILLFEKSKYEVFFNPFLIRLICVFRQVGTSEYSVSVPFLSYFLMFYFNIYKIRNHE